MTQFGYFTDERQTEPEYDPGLGVDCPVCQKVLERPVVTVSLMLPGDVRSYFYRMHADCAETLTPEQEQAIDSQLVDARAAGMLSQGPTPEAN